MTIFIVVIILIVASLCAIIEIGFGDLWIKNKKDEKKWSRSTHDLNERFPMGSYTAIRSIDYAFIAVDAGAVCKIVDYKAHELKIEFDLGNHLRVIYWISEELFASSFKLA